MSETFSLKSVNGGKPFTADEMPKLPPRAMKKMLAVLKAHGIDPGAKLDMDNPDTLVAMTEVAVVMVATTARRMDKTATPDSIGEDEDMEEVLRVFKAVKDKNPVFFPNVPDLPKMAEESADPTSAP